MTDRTDIPSGNDLQFAIEAIEIVSFPMKNGDFPQPGGFSCDIL